MNKILEKIEPRLTDIKLLQNGKVYSLGLHNRSYIIKNT